MIRWLAIHTNVKWPQGIRTVPEADQEIGGTRPTEFARDADELRGLIQRFSGPEAQLSGSHPLFGALSAAEWGDSVTAMRIIIFVNSVPRKPEGGDALRLYGDVIPTQCHHPSGRWTARGFMMKRSL